MLVMEGYELIDCGNQLKFERFGLIHLVRACPVAIWEPKFQKWEAKHASFDPSLKWKEYKKTPMSWQIKEQGIELEIKRGSSGNLGIFPEHLQIFSMIEPFILPNHKVLNLFAYTGLMTLLIAQKRAKVCHVDASKVSVEWARKNAKLNQLEGADIRWIVDDVIKFLKREIKRGSFYDGVILDPPTFGRGAQGQVFKFEKDILTVLSLVKQVLRKKGNFVALSCHTPGISPFVLKQIFEEQFFTNDYGELVVYSKKGKILPCGSFAIFHTNK